MSDTEVFLWIFIKLEPLNLERFCNSYGFVIMLTSVPFDFSVGCKHLEHLDLSNCPRITADGIKILASGCKSLRTLILEYCQEVNDVALEMIALHCAGLLQLNIRHCSVSVHVCVCVCHTCVCVRTLMHVCACVCVHT